MKVEPQSIAGVFLLTPGRHEDGRGFLSETYRRSHLAQYGIDANFVQDIHCYSARAGIVRGLHLQVAPHPQAKLVRVLRGAVFDVAVDARRWSPTYGTYVAVMLSRSQWNQLYVPVGCLHGYCTLEADTEVLYKVSDEYHPECERAVRWDDSALGIGWPRGAPIELSAKDARAPSWSELDSQFESEGQ